PSFSNSSPQISMNSFLIFSLFFAVFITFPFARPEPEIFAWNELEEGIAESVRVPRSVESFRKPFCMCIRAENCPCRNGGKKRGTQIGGININN
ncbi:hypothetical protein PMAYCL1PPCAC_29774, partial [Pristionchus mayeri]